MRRLPKPMVAAIVIIQLFSAVAARRDLSRRTAEQVRGPKLFWKWFVVANPGNAVVYWLIGRRRSPAAAI